MSAALKHEEHAHEHQEAEGLVDIHGGGHGGGGGQHHEEGEQWLISYADLMTLLVGFFVILLSFSQVDQEKMEKLKEAMSSEFGGTYEHPFGQMSDRIRKELEKLGLGDQVKVKVQDDGVEIAFLGTVFFDLGGADMKENGTMILKQVIPVIKRESADFNITIEGHTDDIPVSGGGLFRNNWELSSLRACRVLAEFFSYGGFAKEHIIAVGYGDAKPVVPNRDANGVGIIANQSQNRRVVLRLIKRGESPLGGPGAKDAASASNTKGVAPSSVAGGAPASPPAADGHAPASVPAAAAAAEPAAPQPSAPDASEHH